MPFFSKVPATAGAMSRPPMKVINNSSPTMADCIRGIGLGNQAAIGEYREEENQNASASRQISRISGPTILLRHYFAALKRGTTCQASNRANAGPKISARRL